VHKFGHLPELVIYMFPCQWSTN